MHYIPRNLFPLCEDETATRPLLFAGRALVALTLLGLPGMHCASSPVQEFLNAQAPGYRALQPVSAKDLRGFHLVDPDSMDPATNRCFRGERDAQAYASFSDYTQSYSGGFAVGSELARDFGPAVGAGGAQIEAGKSFNGAITLARIEEYRLQALYFDPASVCAQDSRSLQRIRSGEATYPVITRMLKAGEVRASSADGSHLNLKLAVAQFGGKLERLSQDTQSWNGAELFFAAAPEMYRVTFKEIRREVGQRETIELGRCSASLLAYSPIRKIWNGSLNCQGGESFSFRNQAAREWATAAPGQGGVSYGLQFTPILAKPGLFAAHLIQWTVIAVDD